ncbi:hypothetical protein AgCh_024654 [Apium graveolens]
MISNIYAAVGNWDKVFDVRLKMKNTGSQKPSGASLIELDNEMMFYEFMPNGDDWAAKARAKTNATSRKAYGSSVINSDFKTQLKVTTLNTKTLQGLHSKTHEKVDKLQETADKLDMMYKLDKKRFIRSIQEKVDVIEQVQI